MQANNNTINLPQTVKKEICALWGFSAAGFEKTCYSRIKGSSSPNKERFVFYLLPHSKVTTITDYFRHYTSPRVFQTQSLGKCTLVRHRLQRFRSYGSYLTSAEHIICLERFSLSGDREKFLLTGQRA
jgi:hypothetical protein